MLALAVRMLALDEPDLRGIDEGVELVMVRAHGLHMPFHLAWSLEGLRAHPGRALALLAGLLAVATALVFAADDHERSGPRSPLRATALGALGFFALSVGLPTDYELNSAFGDGTTLATNVGRGMIFGAEIGTSLLFQVATHVADWLGATTVLDAIRGVDALCAAAYGGSLAHLAWTQEGSRRDRLVLALGLMTGGAGLQLLGYIETTAVLLGAMATYLAAAAALADRRGASPTMLLVCWSALGLAVLAHGAGVLLGPSSLYLLVTASRSSRRAHFVAGCVLVVLPVVLVILPRWLAGDIGNANGGGDANRWVPLDFDPHALPSDCVYYGLLDRLHFYDLANALLVSAPALVPALVAALAAGRAAGGRPGESKRGVWLLAWASLGCLVIPLFWNHDFGMWGDWNLASAYLFPAHVLSWLLLVRTLGALSLSRTTFAACVVPVLLVQGLGTLGLALQLYR